MDKKLEPAEYAEGITELTMIRDFIRSYRKRELEILEELRQLKDGVYTDRLAYALIVTIRRDHVDLDGLRTAYPDIVKEFTDNMDVKVVRTFAS